jgi:hypothetical protein
LIDDVESSSLSKAAAINYKLTLDKQWSQSVT